MLNVQIVSFRIELKTVGTLERTALFVHLTVRNYDFYLL